VSTKITFSCNHYASLYKDAPLTKTYNMTVDGSSLMEVIEDFEMFLKGCGFVFDGYLDIVPHEEDTIQEDIPEQFPTGKVTINTGVGVSVGSGGAGTGFIWTTTVPNGGSSSTVNVNGGNVTINGLEEYDNMPHSKHYYDTERNK